MATYTRDVFPNGVFHGGRIHGMHILPKLAAFECIPATSCREEAFFCRQGSSKAYILAIFCQGCGPSSVGNNPRKRFVWGHLRLLGNALQILRPGRPSAAQANQRLHDRAPPRRSAASVPWEFRAMRRCGASGVERRLGAVEVAVRFGRRGAAGVGGGGADRAEAEPFAQNGTGQNNGPSQCSLLW